MRYWVTVAGRTVDVDLTGDRPTIDGRAVDADLMHVPDSAVRHIIVDGRSVPLVLRSGPERGEWEVHAQGRRLAVQVVDERTRSINEMTGGTQTARGTRVPAHAGIAVELKLHLIDDAVGATNRENRFLVVPTFDLVLTGARKLRGDGDGHVRTRKLEAGAANPRDGCRQLAGIEIRDGVANPTALETSLERVGTSAGEESAHDNDEPGFHGQTVRHSPTFVYKSPDLEAGHLQQRTPKL
jgi:hypothetical protein